MIAVRARLYASLRKYQPGLGHGESVSVELREGSRVSDLLERLGIPETETKQVFVNGVVRPLDHELKDGEEVGIFPPIAGGMQVYDSQRLGVRGQLGDQGTE